MAIFAGFKISNADQKISVLPFQLERPEFLGTIFFILVLFYLFQFSLQWAAQKAEIQINQFYRIDFFSIFAVASISTIIFIASALRDNIESLGAILDRSSAAAAIASLIVAILGAISSGVAVKGLPILGRLIKGARQKEEVAISNKLMSQPWILNFNPTNPDANKIITFGIDGNIDEGQNDNEAKWRVRNSLLEILNSDGKVFSRFTYDLNNGAFVHTNDPDTLSIKFQTIAPVRVG